MWLKVKEDDTLPPSSVSYSIESSLCNEPFPVAPYDYNRNSGVHFQSHYGGQQTYQTYYATSSCHGTIHNTNSENSTSKSCPKRRMRQRTTIPSSYKKYNTERDESSWYDLTGGEGESTAGSQHNLGTGNSGDTQKESKGACKSRITNMVGTIKRLEEENQKLTKKIEETKNLQFRSDVGMRIKFSLQRECFRGRHC